MKPELLVLTPIYGPALAALEQDYVVHKLWEAKDRSELLASLGPRVRGAVTTGIFGFTREHLEALPKLEVVGVFGRGHGSLDMAAAREGRIIVANTPDRTAQAVADLAIGLMVTAMRRIVESDRFVRAGRWETAGAPLGSDLGGKTCGIVGLGQIGLNIARRAEAFEMNVCYFGPREKTGVSYPFYRDIEALARESDCLMVACPLTPETRGAIDAHVLAALGPEGFLVNIARGPIVDHAALVAALDKKEIAGAALDVFWDEPRVPIELTKLDNVVLTPHIGTTTREIREERKTLLLANLRAHFSGERVPNAVE